jgi:hypothetical protein
MSFVLAVLIFIGGWALAFLVAFGQGMATAPQYDNSPLYIGGAGTVIAILVAASHWLPRIGW